MPKRILVPLDGTSDADQVLDLVADLARGGGASVRLLHVAYIPNNVEDADGRVVAFADQEAARLEGEAMDHLRVAQARLDGIPTDALVRFGEPVAEILEEAAGFGADLIALSTGHHRNLRSLLLGSTATQVCRRTGLPVVIVKPGGDRGAS